MNVLHVLYQSIPDAKGSSIRSRDLLSAQQHVGISPYAITSPFQRPQVEARKEETLDGVPYIRTFDPTRPYDISERVSSPLAQIKKLCRLPSFARAVRRVARSVDADVIHAHGTFFCGLAGLWAARRYRVPMVYEVRSLWEERVSYGSRSDQRLLARASRRIARQAETFCVRRADAVVTISEGLRQDLQARGTGRSRVFVVPNAVGRELLAEESFEWARKSGPDLVLGYVGNLSPIEGLDVLLVALSHLQSEGFVNPLVVYGAGIDRSHLETLAQELRLRNVRFMGEIKPSEIVSAYRRMDVVVLPRLRSRLTETVTPIKPLEALALGRLLVVSDVAGHLDLVSKEPTCLVFPAGSADSLASVLRPLLSSKDLGAYVELAEQGHRWVATHRNWDANASRYLAIYEQLCT